MSLLSERMTSCHLLADTSLDPDGVGGYIPAHGASKSFDAAIVFNTSLEARRAQAAGVRDLVTITTSRSTVLKYHDVVVRESDGKTFRVTSNGAENYTPASAGLDMRPVTAEEWEPTDVQGGNK